MFLRPSVSGARLLQRRRYALAHYIVVNKWEIGPRTPNLVTILRYARFAGISTDILSMTPWTCPRPRARTDPPKLSPTLPSHKPKKRY